MVSSPGWFHPESNSGNTCNAGWQDYTIVVCSKTSPCVIRYILHVLVRYDVWKVVSDCVWNQACSYSKRQIVFDFLGLTNQRPWFGICLLTLFRQLYTFKHVFIVNKQSNTLVNGFFFMLMICKCNAAAIIRDLTTVFINTILCVQFVYTE